MNKRHERSPWRSNKRTRRPGAPTQNHDAWSYLVKQRGTKTAELIRSYAASVSRPVESLTAKERLRASKLAHQLERLLRRVLPASPYSSFLNTLLAVADGLGKPSTRRPGRQSGDRGVDAQFVWNMLRFGARWLAVIGQDQLTPTELIAVAHEVALPGVDWENRRSLFDNWRKLRTKNLPDNPEELLADALEEIMKEVEKAERRRTEDEAVSRAAKLRAIHEVRSIVAKEEAREFFTQKQKSF